MRDHTPRLDRGGPRRYGRRDVLRLMGRSTLGLALAGPAAGLLAACGDSDEVAGPASPAAAGGESPSPTTATRAGARAAGPEVVVGDVLDFALTSEEWPGPFGFVTLRLHEGVVDGQPVHFIRTDASAEAFAESEGLLWVPRLAGLDDPSLAGAAYAFPDGADGQATVLSSQPGREDYTPAWRWRRVTWNAAPRVLASAAEVEQAAEAGDVTVETPGVVVNYALVRWSDGELPADTERTAYLGPGQLLEPPDTAGGTVTFKLHECYPEARYIVVDSSLGGPAEAMQVAHSPRLAATTDADATGRTNVFADGLAGPGPMGFQPSVFDSRAGDPVWSPYWDHFTYTWNDPDAARLLTSEDEIDAAVEACELERIPGAPPTDGTLFVVNCPVPVVAPNTFTA